MSVFDKIVEFLNDHGVNFGTKEHAPTLTSEDSARERGDDLASGAKAIVYKVQDVFKIFVLPANQRLNPKMVKNYFRHHGHRVKKTRFATAEELMEMTGLVPGSVPPFGHPILDLELYVDPSLSKSEIINFNAGSLTQSISMSYVDYIKISGAIEFDFVKDSE